MSNFKLIKRKTYAVFHDPSQIWLRSTIQKRGPDDPLIIITEDKVILNVDVLHKYNLHFAISEPNKNKK